ncbi:mast cell protease 3-like [Spinachia spinachia]
MRLSIREDCIRGSTRRPRGRGEVTCLAGIMLALHKLMLLHLLASLGRIADGSKIINGTIAPANSMPYMVSLQTPFGSICGGFLVREDFVLTAAHCNRNLIQVVVGGNNLQDKDRKVMYVKASYAHPSYIDVWPADLQGQTGRNGPNDSSCLL